MARCAILAALAGCGGVGGTSDDTDRARPPGTDPGTVTGPLTATGPGTATGGTTTPTVAPCDAGVAVALGTGELALEPLADGDPATMIHGPQGGWHVWIAGDATGVAQEVGVTATVVQLSTGLQLAGDQQPTYLALAAYDDATCSGAFWGVRAFLDDQAVDQALICSLEGESFEVCVTVTEITTGLAAEDCLTLIAALDPADAPICP